MARGEWCSDSIRLPPGRRRGTVHRRHFNPGIFGASAVGMVINRVAVRLSVCASQGDWQAAYAFLRFALQHGFSARSEDGDAMGADVLTDEAALQKGREQFVADVRLLQHFFASSGDEGIE